MKKGRILLVDNELHILEMWKQRLELEGYIVFTASGPVEAKNLIQTTRVHLAIIDMRLADETTENDVSGIKLAAEIDPLIAKIILTGFPSIRTMKMAFGIESNGKASVFNYVSKEEGPSSLLQAIKSAFDIQVRMNFNLEVRLTQKQPSGTLVYLKGEKAFQYLIDEIENGSIGGMEKETAFEELGEIFEKLFYSFDHITIYPISERRGYSGSGVVLVEPSSEEDGMGASVIVKFGTRDSIDTESHNYEKHVKPYLRLRTTQVGDAVFSQSLGGIIYTLVGKSIEEICDFRDYYSEDEISVVESLRCLFEQACQWWYKNRSKPQQLNLAELYRRQVGLLSYEKLKKGLRDVFPAYDQKFSIEFPGLRGNFINPVVWLKGREFPIRSYLCVTHGDLNGRNILIDENGYAWLIDFFRTGSGHILRDFVELESDIKFNCLETGNIEALYEFESSLTSLKRFDDLCEFRNRHNIDELKKAFNIIKELRVLAHGVVKPSNDLREYYIGLFYNTINIIRYPDIRKERKRHALLSASLICQKLEKWK